MKKLGIFLLVLSLVNILVARDLEGTVAAQDDYQRIMDRVDGESQLWWLEPSDEKWSKFRFKLMSNPDREKILRILKNGKITDGADDHTLLDLSFEDEKKRGSGILVVKLQKGDLLGFRMRPTRVVKNALGIIQLLKFDPEKKVITWNSTIDKRGFKGIGLSEDLLSALR